MNIAIIGAGIAGQLMALTCLEQGWQIDLFDRRSEQDNSYCSYVAAGLLTPYAELIQAELSILELGLRSLALWPTLIDKLDTPVFWQQQGSLMVVHPAEKPELMRIHSTLSTRLGDQCNIEFVNNVDLTELEPALTHQFSDGLYFPEEGQLAPIELLAALHDTLKNKGVRWHSSTHIDHLQAHSITIHHQTQHFDWVIDCRGLGAKQDLPNLRGVRGEIICIHAPDVELHRPIRLLHSRYPLYIAPRPQHQFVIGATSIESEDCSPISIQSMLEFLSAAYSLHRGFAEGRILYTYTHCRPALPDNQPCLWMEPGLIRINGLYRHGYLVTPALVEDAVRFMKRELLREV